MNSEKQAKAAWRDTKTLACFCCGYVLGLGVMSAQAVCPECGRSPRPPASGTPWQQGPSAASWWRTGIQVLTGRANVGPSRRGNALALSLCNCFAAAGLSALTVPMAFWAARLHTESFRGTDGDRLGAVIMLLYVPVEIAVEAAVLAVWFGAALGAVTLAVGLIHRERNRQRTSAIISHASYGLLGGTLASVVSGLAVALLFGWTWRGPSTPGLVYILADHGATAYSVAALLGMSLAAWRIRRRMIRAVEWCP